MTAPSHGLSKLALALLAASEAFASPFPENPHRPSKRCDGHGLPNANFETGNLEGWHVVSGNAFGDRSVIDGDATTYWGGRFHQDQRFFVLGTAQSGEAAVGELKSASFQASSALSFLVGGGYDPDRLYVALVRDSDGEILLKQTGINDEALIRITWDTSQWAGQKVHVLIHDSSTSESWGHINFDDLRVGPRALTNGDGMTFNVIGLANQPAPDELPACERYAADPLRPQYHYTPYQGWINDPAGLAQFKGRHHLFSQFHPHSPLWGPMHWAHAESTDAVHWREQPVALFPNETSVPGDTSGRFTGSAMVDKGQLHLVFTEFIDTNAHPGVVQENVAVASSRDGVTFELDSRNPVIAAPPPGAPAFFRDPKIFRDPTDNSWKMAIGATTGDKGQVQLYRSSGDAFSWTHVGVLYTGDGSTGALWECPNFFPIGDKWVLFYGGNGLGVYEVGTYNGREFRSEKRGLLDAGPASYAMQWYKDDSGRNLAITWMANWAGECKYPTRVNGWAGQQSITRELFITADGGLGSRPIKELDRLASGPVQKLGARQVGDQALAIGNTGQARLKLTLNLGKTSASSFTLYLFQNRHESTVLTYTTASRTLTLDTTNAGLGQSGKWEAVLAEPANNNNKLTLDIFLDRSVLEIFTGDGTVMSATVFPRYKENTGISVVAHGGTASFDAISVTPLGSSWC
jgi:sucrose-6-phosphate hydrolase SacC (GH32 family)